MLISVITETYWPEINGVAMTLHRLVTGLATKGHQIQLVCPHVTERTVQKLPENVHYHPVKGVPMPGYKEVNIGLPAKNHLKKLWRFSRPDVIYVATEGPLGLSAIKAANKLGVPVTSGFHTNFHAYSRHYRLGLLENLARRYLASLHNKTQTTIVPTHEQKEMLHAMGIKDVSVMGRGVDTALFSPHKRSTELRKKWGVTGTDPVLLYVGRIAEEKNLGLTIDAYYRMKNKNDKLKFVLVGDGPMANRLKKEHPEFIFAGMQKGENLARYYASGDIFLFSSLTETFGNVILEAMASGLGLVAFNYAAARLHIDSEENGLISPMVDNANFTGNAERIVENEILLKKLRLNAAKYAKQHSWNSIVEQFESLLILHSGKDLQGWDIHRESAGQSI